MKFLAEIDVMPLKELLDPQGKTVANNLKNASLSGIEDVRIGKHIKIWIEAADESAAAEITDTACKKLLCNAIMEHYSFTILPG